MQTSSRFHVSAATTRPLALLIAVAVAASLAIPRAAAAAPVPAVPGEPARVVITASDPDAVADFLSAAGIVHERAGADLVRAEVDGVHDVAMLRGRPGVVAVEPDVPVTIDGTWRPTDPGHHDNWAARSLELEWAWAWTRGGSPGPIVAILDTGTAPHVELGARLLPGADVVTGSGDGRRDRHGHGTRSALVTAAAANNGVGAAGVCPSCRILPIQVLADDGNGTTWTITQGIHAALDRGAHVISISASGPWSEGVPTYLANAVERARIAGVPLVASAGNDGATATTLPGMATDVIAVAGVLADGRRASWSNHGSWVAVAAPACYRVGHRTDHARTISYCGTSAGAPAVAGAVALHRAVEGRALNVRATARRLGTSSRPLSWVAGGAVDACQLLAGGPAAPSVAITSPSSGGTLDRASARPRAEVAHPCGLGQVEVRDGTRVLGRVDLRGSSERSLRVPLDLDALPAGPLELRARATDRHGLAALSARVTVDVVGFTDVGVGTTHHAAVLQLADRNVTSGCTTARFCPDASVTRAQMATFLTRALELPRPLLLTVLSDVSGSHADAIQRVVAADIAAGCGPARFCPEAAVTRAQMATLLVRALDLPPATDPIPFRDVAGTHAEAIGRLAATGITSGCRAHRFCPNAPVTRAQMATFLIRALD